MSFVFDLAAAEQVGALGKYNQSVQNRNATIAEQEAEAIEKQNEFDIARFDQQFAQLQGQTKTAILKSGAELSGSGLNILRYNAEQSEIEKDILQKSVMDPSKKLGTYKTAVTSRSGKKVKVVVKNHVVVTVANE